MIARQSLQTVERQRFLAVGNPEEIVGLQKIGYVDDSRPLGGQRCQITTHGRDVVLLICADVEKLQAKFLVLGLHGK